MVNKAGNDGMLRRRACLALLLLSPALSAQPELLELNDATRAQLESLQGLGPSLTEKILLARRKAPFHDWNDLRRRVRGVGTKLATKLSSQGLV